MSNMAPTATLDRCTCDPAPAPAIEAFSARLVDVVGLPVRRFLPLRQRRLVGPWCFLDDFGPLVFDSGKPMDVAPHPHIGLQTVSWLIEGEVLHNDSLGRHAVARPGALNLMTAGRGIAHSEETPPGTSGSLRGLQLWIALPGAHRDTAPAFDHYPALPTLDLEGGRASVLMGEVAGVPSPSRAFSPIVGADVTVSPGARLVLPVNPEFEHALVPLQGEGELQSHGLVADALYYLGTNRRELLLTGRETGLRALLLGGAPLGETILMWWNFVARTTEEIVAAREDWEARRRFGEVRAYAGERLPAPPFLARPVPGR